MEPRGKKYDQDLIVVKVTPGWGFLEQVLPVVSALARLGHATEIWVPEPWITHLVGTCDPTGQELEKVGASFIAPNGLRGLTRSRSFKQFVLRNRLTSLLLKLAGLFGLREKCYPPPSTYEHTKNVRKKVLADCYFYDSEAKLTLGQRLLRDSDADARHVSFYHGNFDPLSYPLPNALPNAIDIHCGYQEQYERLKTLGNGQQRRVLLSTLPRLATQVESADNLITSSRTVWFFSRSTGPPSGVESRTKVETLSWLSRIVAENDLELKIQLHPSEIKHLFLREAKSAGLRNFSFGKLHYSDLCSTSTYAQRPLLAVANFVGLVPNLVRAGIPCIELWPEGLENYETKEGMHRFDFSERGMSLAVGQINEFQRLVQSVLHGDTTLIERQQSAVDKVYSVSGMSFEDLVQLISDRR